MDRVSCDLPRFAPALLAGVARAGIWVNRSTPATETESEWRLFDLDLPGWPVAPPSGATQMTLASSGLMALVTYCSGRESWEAPVLDRGALKG